MWFLLTRGLRWRCGVAWRLVSRCVQTVDALTDVYIYIKETEKSEKKSEKGECWLYKIFVWVFRFYSGTILFIRVRCASFFFSDFRHLDLPRFDCRFENWFFHYLVFLNNWFQILLFLIVMFKLNLLDMI